MTDAYSKARPERRRDGFGPMVGAHPTMQDLFDKIECFARHPFPLVIHGPTGTGKELAARLVHACSGVKGELVPLNVHALPESLADSELFGVERGAFTGAGPSRPGLVEAAAGGTLVLDEAGELSHALQAKLLRTLESGEVRRVGGTAIRRVGFRLVLCTQEPPDVLMRKRWWRSDFCYRVASTTIHVPPLIDRLSDLPLLVATFARTLGLKLPTEQALARLRQHSWPGGVRELVRVLEHATAITAGAQLDEVAIHQALSVLGTAPHPSDEARPRTLAEVEREHVLAVLAGAGGDVPKAARVLGLSRSALYRRMQEYRGKPGWHGPIAAAATGQVR